MAVRMMTGRENILRKTPGCKYGQWHEMSDYWADAASGQRKFGVSPREHRANTRARWVMMESFTGRVIRTGEMNGYDDSDFYAVVQFDNGNFGRVEYATTRGWTYPNGAAADATPEVQAAYEAWQRELAEQRQREHEEAEARTAYPGREVVFIETVRKHKDNRRVEQGETGTVFWRGEDAFRSGTFFKAYRVGVELADGTKRYVSEDKVRVAEFASV